jgi:hypothetical protein
MQRSVFNCANFRVANTDSISGRATADEINRGLRTGKGRSFSRVASLTFLGTLAVAAFFAAVAPMPAYADNDKDSGHEHEDNDKGILAKIEALETQVAALQDEVKTLQGQLAAVQSNHALLLGPFVNVDPNPEIGVIGPNIIFSGANIHIVSGSGRTDDNLNNGGSLTGLGNLIIGYDEDQFLGFARPLEPGDRGGSHNLVIGAANRFTQAAFGGLVAGEANTIGNEAASLLSGTNNTASGFAACVIGGNGLNTASGSFSVVLGGDDNTASGFAARVLGGNENTASGEVASVLGGFGNTASGAYAIVLNGKNNTAGGTATVVLGGQNVTDNNNNSIAPQPPFP